ncbi:MAG: hypothetical protein HOW73_26975 [Polyangiaceae bacterium]|nr:hypothetical protein [Polyangiaceae bacterium]
MRPNLELGFVSLAITMVACQPAGPSSPEPEPATASAATTAAPPETPAATAEPTAAASATATPADTRVKDACTKLCERVKGDCPAGRGDACLAQCAKHEAKSKGCEVEAEAAFTCQTGANAKFCDNVAAPRCSDAFIRLQRCQQGETQQATSATAGETPGWERVRDETWGVSMSMPKGASVDASAKSRTWKVSLDGATYEIVELPRPAKLDDQSLVKLVLSHVGLSCQKEMRVTGRVDTDKLTFARFETGCSKGERLFGKVRIDANRALSMVVRGNPKADLREAFLDGLR